MKKGITSISTEDFSQEKVMKEVLRSTLQHPVTMYSAVLGLLGLAATATLNLSFGMLLASLGALGGGAVSWIVNYFFRCDVFAEKYLRERREALQSQRLKQLEDLRMELMNYGQVSGAESFSRQSTEQLERIRKKLDNLVEILGEKLDSTELTYGRYLRVAEQVYLSVLDNLRDVATLLKSIGSIDLAYIFERLRELRRLKHLTDADREEVQTLVKRKELRDQQLQKVNVLLTRNEEAMTYLDDATAAIADMQTGEDYAILDMETAFEEMQRLTKQAQRVE